IDDLKKCFFFEMLSCCKSSNRKTNNQVFLFHLVHKFSGTTARARVFLTSSFLELSSSTYYDKEAALAKSWIAHLMKDMVELPFFCWIDNFTKIRRVDWLANFEGKNYQIHDLTVACLFKTQSKISTRLQQDVFFIENEMNFHSAKIFQNVGS